MRNKNTITLSLLVTLLFVIGYFPAFQILVKKWANSDEYSHAFFTVPIILYMVWSKRKHLHESQHRANLGLFLVVLSTIMYLASLQLQIPTFISIAMVMTIVSVLIYLSGFSALKELAIPIALLAIIIPIPNQLYSMITLPLQLKVTQISEYLIQFTNVPIYREGNVIYLPQKTFQVVEACSGLRSMITLITLSLILGYFTLQKNYSKSLLLISSIPIAFFINIIRVITLVLAYHFFKLDLAADTEHAILGLVLFGISLTIMIIIQRLLEIWEKSQIEN